MKIEIKVTQKNPFALLAHIVMALVTYAYFTLSNIPFITYIMLGSMVLYVLSTGNWNRKIGNGYLAYSVIQIVYIFAISTGSTAQSSMARSIIYQMLVCSCFFVYCYFDKTAVNRVLLLISISVVILCVRVFIDDSFSSLIRNIDSTGQYYTYGDNNRNTIGIILGVGALYMLHLGYTRTKLWFIPMALSVVLGLFTGSRKSILVVTVGCLLYAYLYAKYGKKKKKTKGFLAFLFIILFVILLVYACYNSPILYNIVGYRLEGFIALFTGEGQQETSAVIRSMMLAKAIEMFEEKPLFGWGIEGFAIHSGFGVYCHNNYMETLVSFGVFGFMLIYGGKFILLGLQAKAMKAQAPMQISALQIVIFVLMVTSLIIDMAAVTMNGVVTNLPFAFSAAMLFLEGNRRFYQYENSVRSCTD